MEKRTCEFYDLSSLFKDCKWALGVFIDSDPNCDWGNNNHSLVKAELIYDVLDEALCECPDSEQIKTVMARIEEIGKDALIDIEN